MLNWIDGILLVVVGYYSYQGWQAGFADLGLSLVTFLGSLFLAVKFHQPVGDFLADKFGIPTSWATVFGYVIVGFLAELGLTELMSIALGRLPKKLLASRVNKWLGVFISGFNGFVVVTFILLVILALPLRGSIKQDIKNSKLASWLVVVADKYGGSITSTLEQAGKQVVQFRTIEPGSKERVALDVAPKEKELKIDQAAEREILDLVNEERKKAGIGTLTVDSRIEEVARAHSRDMFLRQYFAHVNPEGKTPGDRLEDAHIRFYVAGENLAYAPDVKTAHEGLMNSPGHRKNILDPAFRHVGIGIISTDRYGMMITQDFTN